MARPKGYPKSGGRKPGVKNKKTRLGGEETLEKLVKVMEDPERMKVELNELHGKDYFKVYCDLMAYLRPKYSNIEFKGDVKIGNEVTDRLRMMINDKDNDNGDI